MASTLQAPSTPKKARQKAAIPKDETKQQTLQRIGPGRVSRAIKAVRALGFLKRYDMTESQAQAILQAVAKELNVVKATYDGASGKDTEFKLPTV